MCKKRELKKGMKNGYRLGKIKDYREKMERSKREQ
jgi:hypothetical protein